MSDTIKYGVIQNMKEVKKIDAYVEGKRLISLVGLELATAWVNEIPDRDIIGSGMFEMCGKTDLRVGDELSHGNPSSIVTGSSEKRGCGGHYTSTISTVGPVNYHHSSRNLINSKLLEHVFGVYKESFNMAAYDLSGYVYIDIKGKATSFYCTWENILNKDFDAIEKETDDYNMDYFSSKDKYDEHYGSKKNIANNAGLVRMLIEGDHDNELLKTYHKNTMLVVNEGKKAKILKKISEHEKIIIDNQNIINDLRLEMEKYGIKC